MVLVSYLGKLTNSRVQLPMVTVTKVKKSKKGYNRKKIKQEDRGLSGQYKYSV